jgi:hypothetical protein
VNGAVQERPATQAERRLQGEPPELLVGVGRIVQDALGDVPGLAEKADGGRVGRNALGLQGGPDQRLDGLPPVVAPRVVPRDQRRVLGAPVPRLGLQQRPDPLVQPSPLAQEQPS